MSYSSTVCRKCEKNTYVNLEDSGFLCASCIKEINENQPSEIKKQHVESDDGVVHKSIRWLQSWFFADGVTSNSAYLYWRSPKYKGEEYKVSKYLLLNENNNDSYVLSGDTLSFKVGNLNPGVEYKMKLEALDENNEIIKDSLKAKFKTANL